MKETHPKLVPELCVFDLSKTLSFYVDVCGFTVKYDRPDEGFAYLEKEGSHIMVEQLDKANRTWVTGDLAPPLGRGINFQIEIADVDALYKAVCRSEYIVFMEVEDKWYRTGDVMSGNRQFIAQDPDGYLLRFFSGLDERPVGD